MSVLMRTEASGMTPEQFEANFAPLIDQLKSFPGFVAHASYPAPGGYQVVEVWDSPESHERWVREVIAPGMQRIGITQPPSIQYTPLVRFFTR